MNEQDKSYPFKEMIDGVINGDTYFSTQDWGDLAETIEGMQAACEYKDRQIAELNQKLAECQARESKLLEFCEFAYRDIPMNDYSSELLDNVLALPKYRTALDQHYKQVRHDALMKAAEFVNENRSCSTLFFADELRRMAEDELKQTGS